MISHYLNGIQSHIHQLLRCINSDAEMMGTQPWQLCVLISTLVIKQIYEQTEPKNTYSLARQHARRGID